MAKSRLVKVEGTVVIKTGENFILQTKLRILTPSKSY